MRATPLLISIGLALFTLGGCASDDKAPLLSQRAELPVNFGQKVRVIGTARYSSVTGPSVAAEAFELRVFPRSAWGAANDGKQVEVTGVLHDTTHATPPDPSVTPGEYWLSGVTWQPVSKSAEEDGK